MHKIIVLITKKYKNYVMKIVTKNYSLKNGERSYLVYLRDHNNKSLECYDVNGEERLTKENELSDKYEISDENIEVYFPRRF